jgi:hypothetical protein
MRAHDSDSAMPPTAASTDPDANNLDRAGQTILQILDKAAGVAEEKGRRAAEIAQKLSHQLRAAENRIAQLEAEAATCHDEAERCGAMAA